MDLWLGSRSTQAAGFGSLGTSSHQHPTFPHFTAKKFSISDRKHLLATKSPDTLTTLSMPSSIPSTFPGCHRAPGRGRAHRSPLTCPPHPDPNLSGGCQPPSWSLHSHTYLRDGGAAGCRPGREVTATTSSASPGSPRVHMVLGCIPTASCGQMDGRTDRQSRRVCREL